MPLRDMGELNQGWGICGVTSSFYALYNNNAGMRATLDASARTPTRVLAEIKSFLVMLQANGNNGLLMEIQNFTRSFGGAWQNFTIQNYINTINAAVLQAPNPNDGDSYSLALPPNGVVEYLKLNCGFANARSATTGLATNECIIGLTGGGNGPYNDLKHWVYKRNNTIYSWGQTFADLQGNDFQGISNIGHVITW